LEQPQAFETSDALHARVQRFATGSARESFQELALAIARFQAETSPGLRRLLRGRPAPQTLNEIPALPSEAFRLTRVASYPQEHDSIRFFTSGTTGADRGSHSMRRTDTYEQLSLAFGRQALLPARSSLQAPVVVALAAAPTTPQHSSLGCMMGWFMQHFDGQALDAGEACFDATSELRWLVDETGVNVTGLKRAIAAAERRGSPLLLLGTAFAWVRLLDDLPAERLPLPASSLLMQTGGFKGRSREVSMPQLRAGLCRLFDVAPERVVGEYGMTELTSQLYEATIVESSLGQRHPHARTGVYFEPPWLEVTPVDPIDLTPVAPGETGLASFIDLGNIDSAVRVVTQDLVRRAHGGIELLGRQPGATPRGCSLAIEALIHD
jgi:hypothetical protein